MIEKTRVTNTKQVNIAVSAHSAGSRSPRRAPGTASPRWLWARGGASRVEKGGAHRGGGGRNPMCSGKGVRRVGPRRAEGARALERRGVTGATSPGAWAFGEQGWTCCPHFLCTGDGDIDGAFDFPACLRTSVIISHVYVFYDTSDFPACCFQCVGLSRRLGASRGRGTSLCSMCLSGVWHRLPAAAQSVSGRGCCGVDGGAAGRRARRCLRRATGLAQEPRPATGEARAERRGSWADRARGPEGGGEGCRVMVRGRGACWCCGCGCPRGTWHCVCRCSRCCVSQSHPGALCWARAASPPALKLCLWPMFLCPGVGNLRSSALQDSHFLFLVALRTPGFLF